MSQIDKPNTPRRPDLRRELGMDVLRLRHDEHFQQRESSPRCRVCSYCEHRETVPARTLAEAARPCPNCGARDWRDRVVRRVWPIETTTIER